jgi:DNA-binding NarL/FixJ family response regulator
MDRGSRGGDVRSLHDPHAGEPLPASDDPQTYPLAAGQLARLAPSRPERHWTSARQAPMSVALVDDHSFTRECIAKSLQEFDGVLRVSAFDTCDSCLASNQIYDLVLFHAHVPLLDRPNDGVERRVQFDKALAIAPVIVLSHVDCPDAILDAFESGARGYIPTGDTTLGLALEIARLVKAGGTFVPPSCLALRRTRRDLPPRAEPAAAKPFTPRQMAVLHHLKSGKANKTIARELDMSESTVKIHLRNIMKKMKAANRTEVACRAHALDLTG